MAYHGLSWTCYDHGSLGNVIRIYDNDGDNDKDSDSDNSNGNNNDNNDNNNKDGNNFHSTLGKSRRLVYSSAVYCCLIRGVERNEFSFTTQYKTFLGDTGMLQDDYVTSLAVDALARYTTKSPVALVLAMWEKRVFVVQKEWFQPPAQYQCWGTIGNAYLYLSSLK